MTQHSKISAWINSNRQNKVCWWRDSWEKTGWLIPCCCCWLSPPSSSSSFVITFMQGIYNYTRMTSHVSMLYSVAAVLYLQFMLQLKLFPTFNVLYFYISTFQRMCTVPIKAVFSSALMSWFPSTVLGVVSESFLHAFSCPVITGISFVFTVHISYISTVRSCNFIIFSAPVYITFLSPDMAMSINKHVLCH